MGTLVIYCLTCLISRKTDVSIGYKFSQDKTVNSYGKDLIEFCKATDFRIMNGRLHDDREIGEFTHESNQGKSVIDLFISKSLNISLISNNYSILPMQATESDHKPVFFSLEIPSDITLQNQTEIGVQIESFKWNHVNLDLYLENYSDKCQEELESLLLNISDSTAESNDICKLLYKYINSAIEGSFNKVSSKKLSKFPNNPWFDQECQTQKRTVNDYKNNNDVY